jgi:hypothetical protein
MPKRWRSRKGKDEMRILQPSNKCLCDGLLISFQNHQVKMNILVFPFPWKRAIRPPE